MAVCENCNSVVYGSAFDTLSYCPNCTDFVVVDFFNEADRSLGDVDFDVYGSCDDGCGRDYRD